MAPKVTSSASRSKSKTKKPITTTKGRANRQKVSTAKVSDSSQRTNTGSAKVTGSKPPQKGPVRPSIGNVSGPASNPKPQRPAPTGPVRVSIGRVSGPASSPKAPGSANAKPPAAKPFGNFRAPSIPKAASKDLVDPPKPKGMGSMRTGIAGAAASALTAKFLSPMAFKAGQALGKNVLKPAGQALDRATGKGTPTAKAKPALPAASTPRRVGNIPAKEGTGRGSPNDPPRRSPASTSGGSSSGGGRSSGGGSSAPSRPASRPAAPAMPSAVTKATPTTTAAAPKPASKGPNIGPMADGDKYGKAKKLESKIAGTSDTDMKRRRAFLDAKDSMSGAKAVRELQEKRKKKFAGMLSSETTIAPSKKQY